MGARGPSPTPTKILEARGSWRARGRNGEVQFEVKSPDCPAWLSDEAKAEWQRQARHLESVGVIAEVDRAMLALYCEAWAEFVALAAEVARLGYRSEGLWRLLVAKHKAAERVARLAAQFGFSPSSRANLRAPDAGEASQGVMSRQRA